MMLRRVSDAAESNLAQYRLDFVDEDPGGRPGHTGFVIVNTIDKEGTPAGYVVDRVVYD